MGRWLERICPTGMALTTFPLRLCYTRFKYERVSGKPWMWKEIERTDITDQMHEARMRNLRSIIDAIEASGR